MILFDALAEASIGLALAASEREALTVGARGWLHERSFRRGLAMSGAFYVPAMVVFVALWPGWSSHYVLDLDAPGPRALFIALDAVLLFACYATGYALGARAIVRGALATMVKAFGVAWALVLLLLFAVLAERSNTVMTWAEFAVRPAARDFLAWGAPGNLLGGPVSWALAISAVWNGVPLVLLYRGGRARCLSAGLAVDAR